LQRFKAIVGLLAVVFLVAFVVATAFTAGLVSYLSNMADRKMINEVKLYNFGTEILALLSKGEQMRYMETLGNTAANKSMEVRGLEGLLKKIHKGNYNLTVLYRDEITLSYGKPVPDEAIFFEAEIPAPGAIGGKNKGVLVFALW
jgi:hypothetical protein